MTYFPPAQIELGHHAGHQYPAPARAELSNPALVQSGESDFASFIPLRAILDDSRRRLGVMSPSLVPLRDTTSKALGDQKVFDAIRT